MSCRECFLFSPLLANAAVAVLRALPRVLCSVAGLLFACSSQANNLVWTGGGGANANWNNSANWGSIGTPTNGDTLIFQGVSGLTNTNNIANLTLNQIKFIGASGGFDIHGYNITLTNSILATNTAGANTIEVTNITLATADVLIVVSNGASLNIGSQLQGNMGVLKTGAGPLTYSSLTNSYSGTTTVNVGMLLLQCTGFDVAFGGPLVIGDGSSTATVKLVFDREIPNNQPITINTNASLDLNNLDEDIGSSLTLNGNGSVVNASPLTLGANATVIAHLSTFLVGNATIAGGLNIGSGTCNFDVDAPLSLAASLVIPANVSGSAGISKSGGGFMSLSGSNSFSGQTFVKQGTLGVSSPYALGSTNAGTMVIDTGTLQIYASVTNEALTIASTGIGLLNASGANTWQSPITLSAATTFEIDGVSLDLQSAISGPGGFTKTGAGTLRLTYASNTNSYAGDTTVNQGVLELNGVNVIRFGTLTIGDGIGGFNADVVRYTTSGAIFGGPGGSTVLIRTSGLLDLNGFLDDVGPIYMDGGQIETGTGTLILFPPLAGIASTNFGQSIVNGNLALNRATTVAVSNTMAIGAAISGPSTAPLTKTGPGSLSLDNSNSYAGLTIVQQGILCMLDPFALGATNNGTVVSNGASLLTCIGIGLAVTNEALTLNGPGLMSFGALDAVAGTNIWAGPITINADSTLEATETNAELRISGPISGAGGVTILQFGTVTFEGSTPNTYAGGTEVGEFSTLVLNKSVGVAVPGNMVISGTVRLGNSEQIADTADMLINSGGVFDTGVHHESVDTLRGSGAVAFGLNGWIEVGINNGSSIFDGIMSGTGYPFGGYTVAKRGSGTFTLNGNNTFTAGATHVFSPGKLVVNGFQPQVPAIVDSGAAFGGSGTVGTIAASGNVSPGSSPGVLTSSNVTFSASGSFTVELAGPTAGDDYDQLNVIGTNTLGNATLTVIPAFTSPARVGQQFDILRNNLSRPITGTFNGLPEGATLTAGGYKFTVSYVALPVQRLAAESPTPKIIANDVVLTVADVPGAAVGSAITSGDGNHAIDPNECNNLDLVISNKTGLAMNNVTATLSTTTPKVLITQPYAAYPNLAAGGTSTNTEPFQISTLPAFVCGTDINLLLSVNSSIGSYIASFVQHTGEPAVSPTRYDTNAVISIPDIGSIDSTNIVAGFVGPLTKVVASLYITHTFDSDLTNISLISPDGTTVLLSSANGDGGANYGSNCSPDASRTTFDDAAGTAITNGAAPFTGSFRPQSPLSAFIGNSTPNGGWHLHIADGFGGSLGTLRCWSLFLSGAQCSGGSGSCGYCQASVAGSITNTDLAETNRISMNGVVASCAAPKAYPGAIGGSYNYDVYTFTNSSGADACVTAALSSSCSVHATAYLNSFNPLDISANFAGDAGTFPPNVGGTTVFSFVAPAGATFLVVVNENNSGQGCTNYTLQLSGLHCPAAVLNAQSVPTQNARLYWTTAAGGYLLEATPSLAPTNWARITNEPIVVGGNYNVTNSTAVPTNRFYRLHKP